MTDASAAIKAGVDLHTRLLSTQIHWVIETVVDKYCIAGFAYLGDVEDYLKLHRNRCTVTSLHTAVQARNLNDGTIIK